MNDLISRQAAIDAVRNIRAITGTSDDEILLIDKAEVQTELIMLPSAQPERKRGKWLPDTRAFQTMFVCSECKESFNVDTIFLKPKWNFCPNCGADMRGDINDTE